MIWPNHTTILYFSRKSKLISKILVFSWYTYSHSAVIIAENFSMQVIYVLYIMYYSNIHAKFRQGRRTGECRVEIGT